MLQYGMENLFRKGLEIGIDGMIIPDLPFQEYLESVKPLCEKYDIPEHQARYRVKLFEIFILNFFKNDYQFLDSKVVVD